MGKSKLFSHGSFLFFLLLTYFLNSAFLTLQPLPQPAPDVLLGPASEIPELPIVKRLLSIQQELLLERAKIDYLITRVRESKCIFIRNGESYSGGRAANHLQMKNRKRMAQIRTVTDFIADVGTGSTVTGNPYFIKMPNGEIYRARDIFMNELHALDAYLTEHRP